MVCLLSALSSRLEREEEWLSWGGLPTFADPVLEPQLVPLPAVQDK